MEVFSKKQIDTAGVLLRKKDGSNEQIQDALNKLSYWRAQHQYPLQVFVNRLERVSRKVSAKALVAQRLKRVPSITKKLARFSTRLTQIQDIAGCRIILPTYVKVLDLYTQYYLHGDLKHTLISTDDYILKPKEDGYRSIHVVYAYKSDKENKKKFDGKRIEIQFRTKLQHIWATAVETTSFFTNQQLKLNEGEDEWKLFFKLVSSAFAKQENTPSVPNTPEDYKELIQKITEYAHKLDVINKMHQWSSSIRYIESLHKKANVEYYLLQLDTNLRKLTISTFQKKQKDKAIRKYHEFEKDIYDKEGYDVVLVGAESVSDLKKAYPNYFLDTKEFLLKLREILGE